MKRVSVAMLTVLLAASAPAWADISGHPSSPPIVHPTQPSPDADSRAAIETWEPSTPRRFAAEATAPLPQPPIAAPGSGTAEVPSSAATVWRIPGAAPQPELSPAPVTPATAPPARGPAASIPAEPPARTMITRRLPGEAAAEPMPSRQAPRRGRAMRPVGPPERAVRARLPSEYTSRRVNRQQLNYSTIQGGTPRMANAPSGVPPYPWRAYPRDSLRQ
jgi:hypothetical protein